MLRRAEIEGFPLEVREELLRRGAESLAQRARSRVLPQAAVASLNALLPMVGYAHGVGFVVGLTAIMTLLGLQSWHALRLQRLPNPRVPSWRRTFSVIAILTAASWGVFAAALIFSNGLRADVVVVALSVAGIAGGLAGSVAPDLRLSRGVLVALHAPLIPALAVTPNVGPMIACLDALFLVSLLGDAGRQNQDYWTSVLAERWSHDPTPRPTAFQAEPIAMKIAVDPVAPASGVMPPLIEFAPVSTDALTQAPHSERSHGEGATIPQAAVSNTKPSAGSAVIPSTNAAMPGGRLASRGIRALLAEDNSVNLRVATRMLEREGVAVTCTHNGREAVDATAHDTFDAVFMDIQMPVMDGFEATAAIRAAESATGHHVFIVAMTAHALEGDRERCLSSGMDAYLSKPVRSTDLVRVLNEGIPEAQAA